MKDLTPLETSVLATILTKEYRETRVEKSGYVKWLECNTITAREREECVSLIAACDKRITMLDNIAFKLKLMPVD